MNCKVRVIKEVDDLYPQYRPKVGKVYHAEYVPPYTAYQKFKAICFINVSGKRIILREEEFEIV